MTLRSTSNFKRVEGSERGWNTRLDRVVDQNSTTLVAVFGLRGTCADAGRLIRGYILYRIERRPRISSDGHVHFIPDREINVEELWVIREVLIKSLDDGRRGARVIDRVVHQQPTISSLSLAAGNDAVNGQLVVYRPRPWAKVSGGREDGRDGPFGAD